MLWPCAFHCGDKQVSEVWRAAQEFWGELSPSGHDRAGDEGYGVGGAGGGGRRKMTIYFYYAEIQIIIMKIMKIINIINFSDILSIPENSFDKIN